MFCILVFLCSKFFHKNKQKKTNWLEIVLMTSFTILLKFDFAIEDSSDEPVLTDNISRLLLRLLLHFTAVLQALLFKSHKYWQKNFQWRLLSWDTNYQINMLWLKVKLSHYKNEILNRNICSCKTSSIEFSLENIENNKKSITIKMNSSIITVNGSSSWLIQLMVQEIWSELNEKSNNAIANSNRGCKNKHQEEKFGN